MGLFGGAAQTKTTVKPDGRVDALLRKIAQQSKENSDSQNFVNHDMAQMGNDYKGALSQLAASPELQQAAQALSTQTGAGLDNLASANKGYSGSANNKITASGVQDFKNKMTGAGSLSSQSVSQGTGAGGAISNLGGSAALRSSGRANTNNINATTQNSRGQQMQGMGTNTGLNNNAYTNSVAGLQSGLAGNQLALGAQGVGLGQQAIQNQLNAGNIQQQYDQAQNNNDWQNAQGSQMFDWNKVNNQLNVLNGISPMAGYTSTNSTAAPSQGNQLFGAGLSALGTYGSLGGFSGANALSSGQQGGTGANSPVYKNQWSNSGGTGMFNQMGSLFGAGSK